jgi:hypothetical protein
MIFASTALKRHLNVTGVGDRSAVAQQLAVVDKLGCVDLASQLLVSGSAASGRRR